MVGYQLDDSKSLHRKWLEITKHPFFNGCLGFQAGPNHFCLAPCLEKLQFMDESFGYDTARGPGLLARVTKKRLFFTPKNGEKNRERRGKTRHGFWNVSFRNVIEAS